MPEASKVNYEQHRIHVGDVVFFHFVQVKLPLKQELSQSPPLQRCPPLKRKVFSQTPFILKCPASKSNFIYVPQNQKSHLASGGFTISTVHDALCPQTLVSSENESFNIDIKKNPQPQRMDPSPRTDGVYRVYRTEQQI